MIQVVLQETWRSRYFKISALIGTAFFQGYYYLCFQYEQLFANYSASFGINNTIFFFGNLPTLLLLIVNLSVIVVVLAVQNLLITRAELYTRPYRNLALPIALAIGSSFSVFVVFLLNVTLIYASTVFCSLIDVPYGNVPTVLPTVTLMVFDLPVSLLFWSSLALLVGFAVRNATIAFVVALLAALTHWLIDLALPFNWLGVTANYSYSVMVVSDIAPRLPDSEILLNRATSLVATVGFCFLSAVVYLRQERSRVHCSLASVASLLLAGLALGMQISTIKSAADERLRWTAAHAEFEPREILDLTSIAGSVVIQPGNSLELDLDLTMTTPHEFNTSELVFSFNPGMSIERLSVNDSPQNFTFDDGLLSVPYVCDSCAANETLVLSIEAVGSPNLEFGYLEPELDYLADPAVPRHMSKLLGTTNSIFNGGFIALMPGIRWYPSPGPLSVDKYVDALVHAPDLFDVQLQVSIAESNWLAAGPGHRTRDPSANSSFTFRTSNEVTHFGIFASEFDSKVLTTDSLELEVLVHKQHTSTIDSMIKVEDEFRNYVAERLASLAALDLEFKDKTITLVEVPNYLRFVGGYGMEFIHSLPGVVLFKESSLPLSNIDDIVRGIRVYVQEEDEIVEALFSRMSRYTQENVVSGNLEEAIAHQLHPYAFHGFQTNQVALNYLRRMTVSEAVTAGNHLYLDVDLLVPFAPLMKTNPITTLDKLLRFYETYEPRAVDISINNYYYMSSVDPYVRDDESRNSVLSSETLSSRRFLHYKTRVAYSALSALHGDENAHRMIAPMVTVNNLSDEVDSFEYVYRTANSLELNLSPFLREWLTTDSVPSFRVSEARSSKVSVKGDDVNYRASLSIRNDSNSHGIVWMGAVDEVEAFSDIPVVEIPPQTSVEINAYSMNRITEIRGATFHSRNSGITRFVPLPDSDESENYIRSPTETSDWTPDDDEYIVVDNLDPGTRVLSMSDSSHTLTGSIYGLVDAIPALPRLVQNGVEYVLPNAAPFRRQQWHYETAWTAYGKYDQSLFQATSETAPTIRFTANLPASGEWSLDYYFPYVYSYWDQYGEFNFVLRDGTTALNIDFDANSLSGWNRLGTFEIEGPNVHLDLVSVEPLDSPRVADAIRWKRVE